MGKQHQVIVASMREDVLDQTPQASKQTLPEALT
jgi:hypothetical protein